MSLIADRNIQVFDLNAVGRGDLIRLRRAGDTMSRNGFVTRVTEQMMEVLFCNVQNNATSFLQITAVDVAVGVWEIRWSSDLVTINIEPGGGGSGGSGLSA